MMRFRLAAPVALLYWLMLVAGLTFFTALRIADAWEMLPLWVGALGGTALGQFLALRDYRLWVTVAFIIAVLTWCVPVMPPELSSTELWMAFVPATLCGFWSLAERASLAAFWFPTVVWMLSILDRTSGQATPDGAGIVLLGALAVLFVVFLRLREARRVALWRTVAATPLATAKPNAVLREPPGRHLARGGWALLVSAITFGVTAWIAPHLWQTESFDAGEIQIPELGEARGLPCCPVAYDLQDITRSRVSEYFDIGRGHDEITEPPRQGIDCQACEGPVVASTGPSPGAITGGSTGDGGGDLIAGDPGAPATATTTLWGGQVAAGQRDPWLATTAAPEPPAITEPVPAAPVDPVVPPVVEVPAPAPVVDPAPLAPAPLPESPLPATPEPPAPELASATPPPPAGVERLPITAAAAPAPAPASSMRSHRAAPAGLGPSLLHWIAVLVAAALMFQLTTLALRPLRRWITLRHLRRPFWDETIDQRVSNAWQLALVGLRDAGWRSTSDEAPREFARRVGVQGLERCATILERARHGIAIDAEDLSEMTTSADAAYRSARGSIAPVARTLAWVRWPLT